VIQELDSKQRKIRSPRGFFLYALEIMENGEDYEILNTNLQSFFWGKVKNIIQQNKKAALQEFLFGYDSVRSNSYQGSNPQIEEIIKTLQNQVNSLQDRISDIETTLENSKYALRDILEAPRDTKNIHQGDFSTLKSEKSLQSANLLSNDSKVNLEIKEPRYPISESLSEDKIRPLEPLSDSHQHNPPSNKDKAQNQTNFITLRTIS
jgi:hypothetical protein